MALEKGSEEWYMFMDYWNICKAFWDVQDSDDYWKGLIANLNVFLKKYNYDFFAAKIVETTIALCKHEETPILQLIEPTLVIRNSTAVAKKV